MEESDSELLKSQSKKLQEIKKNLPAIQFHNTSSSDERHRASCRDPTCSLPPCRHISENSTLTDSSYGVPVRRSSTISLDATRIEMKWTKKHEDLLEQWKDQMLNQSQAHKIAGRKYKRYYSYFNLPASLIPIIIGTLNTTIQNDLIISILLMISSVLMGVSSFYNFGSLYEKHGIFQTRYEELALLITLELTKEKKHRLPVDVFVESTRLKLNQLSEEAPNTQTIKNKTRSIDHV